MYICPVSAHGIGLRSVGPASQSVSSKVPEQEKERRFIFLEITKGTTAQGRLVVVVEVGRSTVPCLPVSHGRGGEALSGPVAVSVSRAAWPRLARPVVDCSGTGLTDYSPPGKQETRVLNVGKAASRGWATEKPPILRLRCLLSEARNFSTQTTF
jgi:hypothetical protein